MHRQPINLTRFGDVLDAADTLSPNEQLTLVGIVMHRLAERSRKRVLAGILEARQEYAEGRCRLATVNELMNEILS